MVFERVYPLEGLMEDVEPGQNIEYVMLEEINAWLPGGIKWEQRNNQRLPVYADAKRMVETYDPKKEMIVSIFDQSGYDDTYRVSLPQ